VSSCFLGRTVVLGVQPEIFLGLWGWHHFLSKKREKRDLIQGVVAPRCGRMPPVEKKVTEEVSRVGIIDEWLSRPTDHRASLCNSV
jgi:hypothetical protein